MKKFLIWLIDIVIKVSKIIFEVVGDFDMYNFVEDIEELDWYLGINMFYF